MALSKIDTAAIATDAIEAAQLKSDAIAVGDLPTGSVLQVVSGSTTTNTSTSSTSFVSTNITASITPSSTSNKVLVIVSTATETITASNTGADNQQLAVFRGSTDIASSNVGTREANGFYDYVQTAASLTILDAPSTTSSTTYTVKIKSNQSSTTIKAPPNSHQGVITLLEIAG